jgi:hypothetical protein
VRFAAKQNPHRPGIAPAIGLRARGEMCPQCTADHDDEQTMSRILSDWSRYVNRRNLDRAGTPHSRLAAKRKPRRLLLRLEPLQDRSSKARNFLGRRASSR